MSWHDSISITHAPSGHPGGILDRLRLMQESGLTLCPFLEGAFCPLSREATRGEGDLRILWLRGLGIRRRCGSRGRTDSKMRRVWFVNGTATPQICAALHIRGFGQIGLDQMTQDIYGK